MLAIINQIITFQELHYIFLNNPFHNFPIWSVICWILFGSFFKDSCDIGPFPFVWYNRFLLRPFNRYSVLYVVGIVYCVLYRYSVLYVVGIACVEGTLHQCGHNQECRREDDVSGAQCECIHDLVWNKETLTCDESFSPSTAASSSQS